MQMYPKKLDDLNALQRERFRLKVQIKAMESQGLLEGGIESPSVRKGIGWARSLMNDSGWVDWILPLAPPVLSWITRGARKRMSRKLGMQVLTVAGIWLAFRYLKAKWNRV